MASEKQEGFIRDLLLDLERLFHAGRKKKTERDFAAWMGGLLNKHVLQGGDVFLTSKVDLERAVGELTSYQAWRLIKALEDVRSRLEVKLPRESVVTSKAMLTAIWTAARRRGLEKDDVAEMVAAHSGGETTSTRQLRRDEALEILRKLGGSVRVFEMQRRKGGGVGLKETRKSVV